MHKHTYKVYLRRNILFIMFLNLDNFAKIQRNSELNLNFCGLARFNGTLNGADLAAIHAADGRLANVTELDLSEVSLVASDDCYATYKTDAYDCYLEYSSFYYSETCKRDSSHYSTMLGTGVTEIAR